MGNPRIDDTRLHEKSEKNLPYDESLGEYDRDLMERLEAHLVNGPSQVKAAELIGISQTALSHYRHSKYKGSVANLEEKIEFYLDGLEEKAERAEIAQIYALDLDYVPTSVSEEVYSTIKYCRQEKGIVIIHGDAGIGKTKAAEKYMKENKHVAVYIRATPSCSALGSFLKMLASALRMPDTYSKYELMKRITKRISGRDMVLIVDEAQHLKPATLEELRSMSDTDPITGEKGIGIVLIGNTEVYDRMLGTQEARFAQLFSRVKLNREYSTRNIKMQDVRLLFPLLTGKSMERELDFMLSVCQSKWGVRGAMNVYTNASNNEDISYKGLVQMAQGMGIGLL